jgi:Ca2+-binding RTX toxin-like protein
MPVAKVKFTELLDGHIVLLALFSGSYSLELAPSDDEQATYLDTGTGTRLILNGSGFAYDGEAMTAGTITSIVLADEEGGRYLTASKSEWNAATLMEIFVSEGFYDVQQYIFRGKDQIIGSDGSDTLQGMKKSDTIDAGKGNDWIYGDEGNDRLTGGLGSDQFNFFADDGRDVITDFDANGGGNKQDYLRLAASVDYREKHTDDGLLLKFETGDRLLLLDVTKLDKTDVSFL